MTHWQDVIESTLKAWVRKPRLGIITDVDGTLSPIVSRPEAAQVTARNKSLLTNLLPHCTLVAAVSGRAAADIHARVGIAGMVYVGNHGLERWQDGEVVISPEVAEHRPAIEAARDELPALLSGYDEAEVEDKGPTLSLHYRNVADPSAFATKLRPLIRNITEKHNLHLHEGRMVFEIRPPLALNKGTAMRALVDEFKLDAAVYLGDDTTDVDAIRAARALREADACYAFGLGVDSEETPSVVIEAADFSVLGVSGVEDFFDWVLMARSASSN